MNHASGGCCHAPMANCLLLKPGLIAIAAVAVAVVASAVVAVAVVSVVAAVIAVIAAVIAVVAAVVVGQNMASFFLRHLSARVRLIEGRLLLMKAHESS